MRLEDFFIFNTDPVVFTTKELYGFSLTLTRKDDVNWLARLMFDEAVVCSKNYASTIDFLDDLNWIGNHIYLMLLYQVTRKRKEDIRDGLAPPD